MKITVRKIRPEDAGYGTREAVIWPWLVFGRLSDPGKAMALPTFRQALHYALTGESLLLSPWEKRELQQRWAQDPIIIESRRKSKERLLERIEERWRARSSA